MAKFLYLFQVRTQIRNSVGELDMQPQKLICPKCGSEDIQPYRPIFSLVMGVVAIIFFIFLGHRVYDWDFILFPCLAFLGIVGIYEDHYWLNRISFICRQCEEKFSVDIN